jgi:Dockerin type I domain
MKNTNKSKSKMHVSGIPQLPAVSKSVVSAILSAFVMATYNSQASAVALKNTISGEVERIIVDTPTDRWSRGTMVVGGQNVIIPRNLVIDLPANRLTLQELFVNAPSACPDTDSNGVPDETGLAKADSCNHSFTGAAVTILANKTSNGDVIAGDVFLEKATEIVSGIISYINYDEGYFRVDGNPGDTTTGAMVRVNDPEGRFTHQVGAGCLGSGPNCSADVRYGVDPDNYTFTAATGYPMCIPSTVARTYDLAPLNPDGTLGTLETGLTAIASSDGSGDALCPQTNRSVNPVGDSRLFAPIQVGDHVNAEGNFETIDGVTFLSAHTVGVSVGLTTDDTAFQPDYMIFDEVGWDIPGFQNQRIRDLLIMFGTLGSSHIDVFGLYYDPMNTDGVPVKEVVFATTYGCDQAGGAGLCSNQALVGNTAVYKIVHDVDFINGVPIKQADRRSPCAHLQAAYAGDGIPDKDGVFHTTDPLGRCTTNAISVGNMGEEFAVLSPPTRDLIGRSRHKHTLDPSVVTLDFHGRESQNGEYLNPVGLGHPEFVEIDLGALQTPYIFAGIPWNMDRRLSPGGGCDDVAECDNTTPIGDPSMSLDPFPYSQLDPGTQAGIPGVPRVIGYGTPQRNRTLSYYPFYSNPTLPLTQSSGGLVMAWPPIDPAAQGITSTQHAGLMCALLSGIDTDGDGVDDAIDNCTLIPNTDQRDTNGDGYGNICDADFNNNGAVDSTDLSQIKSLLRSRTSPHQDLNGNGVVDSTDYSIAKGYLRQPPGPSCCGI